MVDKIEVIEDVQCLGVKRAARLHDISESYCYVLAGNTGEHIRARLALKILWMMQSNVSKGTIKKECKCTDRDIIAVIELCNDIKEKHYAISREKNRAV